MGYQLKIDEILEALEISEHPQRAEYIQCIEIWTSAAARALAAHLEIDCGEAKFEGLGFAGTCVPFWPRTPGQPIPDAIAGMDAPDDENWVHPNEGS